MKIIFALLVALLVLNGAFAVPARLPSDDAEVIDVPRRTFTFGGSGLGGFDGFGRPFRDDDDSTADIDIKNFKGVISTDTGTGGADAGAGYPFLQPHPPPFSFNLGFFNSFDDIFRRLHTRLWPSELPGVSSGTDDSEEASGVAFNIDPKKGNTTSTVKVVDGHKVEVNETTYGDANSVFKVRVVNIRPVESGEEVEETVKTNTATNEGGEPNPVTSAPRTNAEEDDSDERREPLEKKSDDNEINRNADDPEVKY